MILFYQNPLALALPGPEIMFAATAMIQQQAGDKTDKTSHNPYTYQPGLGEQTAKAAKGNGEKALVFSAARHNFFGPLFLDFLDSPLVGEMNYFLAHVQAIVWLIFSRSLCRRRRVFVRFATMFRDVLPLHRFLTMYTCTLFLRSYISVCRSDQFAHAFLPFICYRLIKRLKV